MRVVAEIAHPLCKISIFHMNQKFIVKYEQGNLEQNYKIGQLDYIINDVEDIKKIIEGQLTEKALAIFKIMQANMDESLSDY